MSHPKESFEYDGIAVVEVTLDSGSTVHEFPASTTVDKKKIVAVECFSAGSKSPANKNIVGTTSSAARLATFVTLVNKDQQKVVDSYPVAHMERTTDTGPMIFSKVLPIDFPACRISTPNTSLITSGEVVVFYFFYKN